MTGRDHDSLVPFTSVITVKVVRQLVWRQIVIETGVGPVALRGVSSRTAESFRRVLLDRMVAAHRDEVQRLWPAILDLHRRITELPRSSRYIRRSDVRGLAEDAKPLAILAQSSVRENLVKEADRSWWDDVCQFATEPEGTRSAWNESFIRAELDRWQEFFDTFEKDDHTGKALPLSEEQRRAIVTDEDCTLVVAAAGSGKTSVIAAKVAYLLKAGLANSSEILALCFTNEAATELKKRVHKSVRKDIHVATFHSLGLSIVKKREKKTLPVSKLAKDPKKRQKKIQEWIEDEARNDPDFAGQLMYFASYVTRYRSRFEFSTKDEYETYLKTHEPRSLNGDLLRSYEECEIANFLYLNGISYVYEAVYPDVPPSPDRKLYEPDFFLKDYDIYIEHFAIDEHGKTPPFIDQAKYTEGVEWKRQLHKERGTKLIETYSYQKRNGTLLQDLRTALEAHGVKLEPMTGVDPLRKLRELGRIDRFSERVDTFLQHVKSNQHSMGWLCQQAEQRPDRNRMLCFLALFERVYERYTQYLKDLGEIDFHDMVNKAVEHVSAGRFRSPYRYVVVDEFQDVSISLARLVLALLNQRRPEARLFCVGDDWQAIYRFAGADLSIMLAMEERFGYTKRLFLSRTFRFNSAIAAVSSQFVLKNKAQIRKEIVPASDVNEPRVFVVSAGSPGSRPLETVFRSIAKRAGGRQCEVFVLSRYSQNIVVNHVPYLSSELARLKERYQNVFPNIRVCPDTRMNHRGEVVRTVHSVKGLQADYVIVVGLCRGRYGFPCEIMDDPIIDMVLTKSDPFPNAEERRLLYVALTRAKEAVFLLSDPQKPSTFITELEREGYRIEKINEELCPACVDGVLVVRNGPQGEFLGCSNFPACRCTRPIHHT